MNQQAMRELIPKLFAGETRTRQEIIEGAELAHRQRGGEATEDFSNGGRLVATFKVVSAWLKKRGAIENAGHGYWHVIGGSTLAPGLRPPADERPGGRDSISGDAYHEHMKLALYARQKGRCANTKCNRHFPKAVDFDLDHIVPRARGGSDEPDNLQLLCRQCNTRKGAGR